LLDNSLKSKRLKFWAPTPPPHACVAAPSPPIGVFKEHSRNIQGTLSEHLGNIQVTFRKINKGLQSGSTNTGTQIPAHVFFRVRVRVRVGVRVRVRVGVRVRVRPHHLLERLGLVEAHELADAQNGE
jgi:hypothetical protein